MSDTQAMTGFCYLCNTAVDADVQAHFNESHSTPASKVKTPVRSWEHRTRNVMDDLSDLLEDNDPNRQIAIIDGVLQELYLVRARLTEKRRNKEGMNNGRS